MCFGVIDFFYSFSYPSPDPLHASFFLAFCTHRQGNATIKQPSGERSFVFYSSLYLPLLWPPSPLLEHFRSFPILFSVVLTSALRSLYMHSHFLEWISPLQLNNRRFSVVLRAEPPLSFCNARQFQHHRCRHVRACMHSCWWWDCGYLQTRWNEPLKTVQSLLSALPPLPQRLPSLFLILLMIQALPSSCSTCAGLKCELDGSCVCYPGYAGPTCQQGIREQRLATVYLPNRNILKCDAYFG